MDENIKDLKALIRLSSLGDWLSLGRFDNKKLLDELETFRDEWKRYNPRKDIKRFGLSVTSFDGGLSGVPDLDSLYEYNRENNTDLKNKDCIKPTPVLLGSEELQKILAPYRAWLTRCHFIRLDKGAFFPEHYDIDKLDYNNDEIRLIAMVNNCESRSFKFCYEDNVLNFLQNGKLYYFNANKRHTVFSTVDNSIQLVIVLKFDHLLMEKIVETYEVR